MGNKKAVVFKIPQPQVCQVWLDFDGTITRQDVLDELIKKFSIDDSWKIIEEKWQKGLIGSRRCLQEQFDLLRVSPEQLERTLDGIELDEGIFTLLELLESQHVPVMVISDSVDVFIRRILHRNGITKLTFRSNGMVHQDSRLKLQCSDDKTACRFEAAHCKCRTVEVAGDPKRRNIYIGDGRSDLCPARRADYVFAKGILAQCLEKESIPFNRYSNLNDVAAVLSRSWQKPEIKSRLYDSIAG